MIDMNELSLEEKVKFIIEKYNNGYVSNYAENMLYAINKANNGNENYAIRKDYVIRKSMLMPVFWYLNHLLGECILANNENFFNEK